MDFMESRAAFPTQVINMPEFWSQVSKSRHSLLALDYDGTLAPFHVDPMQAHPLPGIPALLKALSTVRTTTVAIISGRPVREVVDLLGIAGITIIGCHGYEIIDRDGNFTKRGLNPEQLDVLETAAGVALALGFGKRLEVKTASIALHTRGMPPGDASKIEETILREWLGIAAFDMGCRRFDGGVEIFCTGWTKGDAICYLLEGLPMGTLPVYIGDDATDEDAFRYIRERGVGIKVGSPQVPTSAKGFLPDTGAVMSFLRTWLSLADAERSSAKHGIRMLRGEDVIEDGIL